LAIAPQSQAKLKEGCPIKTIALHCKNVAFRQQLHSYRLETAESAGKVAYRLGIPLKS
jgi:hypothetical protein